MRRTIYKLHKWIAVAVGVFFLVWLTSGIVMILPPLFPGPPREQKSAALDFREITVSPAQAVANLAKALGSYPRVSRVTLRPIGKVLAYEVSVQSGNSHLIDARSGQVFTITPEIAEQIARGNLPSQGRVLQIERINRHSYAYQWGPIPAYRIVFDNDQSTSYYVSTHDGTVRRSDRWNRVRGVMESLHTFRPLKLITKREAVRKGMLILLSVVGIGAALTGYYLSLPRRWVSRHVPASDTFVPRDVSDEMSDGFELGDKAVTPSFQRRK
jgi:uncharacterized iron-regulated membrane protein